MIAPHSNGSARFKLRTTCLYLFTFVGAMLACAPASAAVLFVDSRAPAGGNGTSWTHAHRSLRTALQNARAGDTIRVARGVYRPAGPNGNRWQTFRLPAGVIVQGGYAGLGAPNPNALKPKIYITRLSGDLNSNDGANSGFTNYADNSYHVVIATSVGPGAQLRGLYVSGGNANATDPSSLHSMGGGLLCVGTARPTLANCVFERNFATWNGGALRANDSPRVQFCTFRNNATDSTQGAGGAVWTRGGTFSNCVFNNNVAGMASTAGGGLCAKKAAVTSCTFQNNSSGAIICGDGSVIRLSLFKSNVAEDGAAILVPSGAVDVIDCDFVGNTSASLGGAMLVRQNGSLEVVNSLFHKNGSLDANAIYNVGEFVAVNCVFTGTTLSAFGGGTSTIANNGSMELVNCTIAFNNHQHSAAAVISNGTLALSNSILWGNSSEGLDGETAQLQIRSGESFVFNNCIGGYASTAGGNFDANPMFMQPAGTDAVMGTLDDDMRLDSDSPCRNAGDNTLLPADDHDLDADSNTAETLPLDIDRLPRVRERRVDVGAHEI